MKLTTVLGALALIIFFIGPSATGIIFTQDIKVHGNGNLDAKTDTDAAKGTASGTGTQVYTRSLSTTESATSLSTKYVLSSEKNNQNSFSTQINTPVGIDQIVTITQFTNITATSQISQAGLESSQSYSASVTNGTMDETITRRTDPMSDKNGHEIVETTIQGTFDVTANFADDGGILRLVGFNPEVLLNRLDAVNMIGEIPVSDGNVEFIYGELESEVQAEVERGIIPLGKRAAFYAPTETASGKKIFFIGG